MWWLLFRGLRRSLMKSISVDANDDSGDKKIMVVFFFEEERGKRRRERGNDGQAE
jgi:hypothetical protein